MSEAKTIWEGDTSYGHYQIIDTLYDGRSARVLYSGDRQAAQSGLATDGRLDLLFDYNQRIFELARSLEPQKVLIIGGGVGTLAKALLDLLPTSTVDIVEPDAQLVELGHKYFGLPRDERLQTFYTDGRAYLRDNTEQYDLIVVDAFVHTAIPQELKTKQAFESYKAHVTPNGLLAVNIISRYHGSNPKPLYDMYVAATACFQTVEVMIATKGYSQWLPQNFVLACQPLVAPSLQDSVRYGIIDAPDITGWPLLTDSS